MRDTLEIEELAANCYKVRLFDGSWLYAVPERNCFIRRVETIVNGKPKVDWKKRGKEFSTVTIYDDIKEIYALDGKLLAGRLHPGLELSVAHTAGIPKQPTTSFILKMEGSSVKLLTGSQKQHIKSVLQAEGISYCEFRDQGRNTIIKTTPKGYRVLAFLQV